MKLLLKLIFKKNWKKIALITILSIIIGICQIYVLEHAAIVVILVKNNTLHNFIPLLYRLGIVILFSLINVLIVSYLSISLASNSAHQIKNDLFNVLIEFNTFDKFNKLNFSVLLSRAIRGVDTIQSLILFLIKRVLMLIIASILVLYELYHIDYKFAIIFTIFLIIITVIFSYKLNSLANIYYKVMKINGKLNMLFREKNLTLKLVKAYSKEEHSNKIFKKNMDETYKKGYEFQYKISYIYYLIIVGHINILLFIVLFLILFDLDKSNGLDIFMMLLYIFYWTNKFTLVLPLFSIYPLAHSFSVGIEEVLHLKDKSPDSLKLIKENEFEGIEFNNVSLTMSNRKILSNISLKIPKNSKTLIVGPISSGKTTLMYSLMGFHKIDSGKILIDGFNINSGNLNEKISLTPEKPFLLKDSVFENIRLGKESISYEDAQNICNEVLFEKDLSFEVNEYGNNLTNESKQKLSIVRALTHDRDYYIFDNYASFLNPSSKHIIKENIMERLNNKTIIFVGNDFDYCLEMDNIIVLNNGIVVDSGKHDELIKTCEIYKKLFEEYGGNSNI
ncbi:ATP-binding cassette domain-containing protein [Methanobrevibacter sp.]